MCTCILLNALVTFLVTCFEAVLHSLVIVTTFLDIHTMTKCVSTFVY